MSLQRGVAVALSETEGQEAAAWSLMARLDAGEALEGLRAGWRRLVLRLWPGGQPVSASTEGGVEALEGPWVPLSWLFERSVTGAA